MFRCFKNIRNKLAGTFFLLNIVFIILSIVTAGAKPVFVDCDDSFCMDVNLIEKKINKKTKAIVPVHFTGYMTNMIKLKKISKKYKIPIVEDACQSILASINKKNSSTSWMHFSHFDTTL